MIYVILTKFWIYINRLWLRIFLYDDSIKNIKTQQKLKTAEKFKNNFLQNQIETSIVDENSTSFLNSLFHNPYFLGFIFILVILIFFYYFNDSGNGNGLSPLELEEIVINQFEDFFEQHGAEISLMQFKWLKEKRGEILFNIHLGVFNGVSLEFIINRLYEIFEQISLF